jgi:hypothetical protein
VIFGLFLLRANKQEIKDGEHQDQGDECGKGTALSAFAARLAHSVSYTVEKHKTSENYLLLSR